MSFHLRHGEMPCGLYYAPGLELQMVTKDVIAGIVGYERKEFPGAIGSCRR